VPVVIERGDKYLYTLGTFPTRTKNGRHALFRELRTVPAGHSAAVYSASPSIRRQNTIRAFHERRSAVTNLSIKKKRVRYLSLSRSGTPPPVYVSKVGQSISVLFLNAPDDTKL